MKLTMISAGLVLFASAGALSAASFSFQQGVNGYTGTSDTELQEVFATGIRGQWVELTTDLENLDLGGGETQILMKFEDLFGTGAGQIDLSTQTVTAAKLELEVTDSGDGFRLHHMLTAWDESTANWNSFGSGVNANGIEAQTSAVASLGFLSEGALEIDVTASLLDWASGTLDNQGWAFLPAGLDGVSVVSSNDFGGGLPRLVVETMAIDISGPGGGGTGGGTGGGDGGAGGGSGGGTGGGSPNVVPLPAGAWLMLTGLVGLGALRRRA